MKQTQKVIKYIAIAFGSFLSVVIIGTILSATVLGLRIFGGVLELEDSKSNIAIEKMDYQQEFKNIENIKIEGNVAKFILKEADTDIIKVEVKKADTTLKVMQQGKDLVIKEEDIFSVFGKTESAYVQINVPKGTLLKKVEIDNQAGNIEVANLQIEDLVLEVGAGTIKLEQIQVKNHTKIDGGAGKIEIIKGFFNSLDFSGGIGDFYFNGTVKENSEIEAGIGKLELELIEKKEDYQIKIDKGLGALHIQGESIQENTIYGEGNIQIRLECGIGSTSIKFIEENSL